MSERAPVGGTEGEESEEETWTSESEADSESEGEESEHKSMSQSMTMTQTSTKTTTKFQKTQYEDMDIESLIDQLSAEEIEALTGHVDPDDSHIPPAMRSNYRCEKETTGELDRDALMEHVVQEAINEPDREELVPFEPGKIRGKKWVAPKPLSLRKDAEDGCEVTLDLEYENALAGASEDEIVDLAEIDNDLAGASEEEIAALAEFMNLL